jgi:purine-binding chemotaxis protein CheW
MHHDSVSHLHSNESIELLTFIFNEVIFGLDILQVDEIHSVENQYSLKETIDSIHPVISVRGNNIQIIDFGNKFGLVSTLKQSPKNIIIINHHQRKFGIVVDGVTEVITTHRSLLTMPAQSDQALSWFNYSSGLIKIDENILVVLDLEKLITHQETSLDEGQHGE